MIKWRRTLLASILLLALTAALPAGVADRAAYEGYTCRETCACAKASARDALSVAGAAYELPETLWYNASGGTYYHMEQQCEIIHPQYFSQMRSFSRDNMQTPKYRNLTACPVCVVGQD